MMKWKESSGRRCGRSITDAVNWQRRLLLFNSLVPIRIVPDHDGTGMEHCVLPTAAACEGAPGGSP